MLCIALAACPGPPPPNPTPWGEGAFELGVHDLNDMPRFGASVDALLEAGAQGGFHVPVTYRVIGHAEHEVTFAHVVRRKSDSVLVSQGSRLFDVTGGVWTGSVIPIFICPTPIGTNALGEALTLEVTASRSGGEVVARQTVEVTLSCPESSAYCASICKG